MYEIPEYLTKHHLAMALKDALAREQKLNNEIKSLKDTITYYKNELHRVKYNVRNGR